MYDAQETRKAQIFKSVLHFNADLQLEYTAAMFL